MLAIVLSGGLLEAARQSGIANARRHWEAALLPIHLKLGKNCTYPLLEKDIELRELLRLKSTPKLHIFFSRNSDPMDKTVVDVRTYRVPANCVEGFATRLQTRLNE